MILGPFRIKVNGGDARGDKVRLHRAGLVRVPELQEWECGRKLCRLLLGSLAERYEPTTIGSENGANHRREKRSLMPLDEHYDLIGRKVVRRLLPVTSCAGAGSGAETMRVRHRAASP